MKKDLDSRARPYTVTANESAQAEDFKLEYKII
jgi:hypothetical protein